MNKGNYSIGYIDYTGHFGKVWLNGYTRKFESIEETKNYINEHLDHIKEFASIIKIMHGWKVIEVVYEKTN